MVLQQQIKFPAVRDTTHVQAVGLGNIIQKWSRSIYLSKELFSEYHSFLKHLLLKCDIISFHTEQISKCQSNLLTDSVFLGLLDLCHQLGMQKSSLLLPSRINKRDLFSSPLCVRAATLTAVNSNSFWVLNIPQDKDTGVSSETVQQFLISLTVKPFSCYLLQFSFSATTPSYRKFPVLGWRILLPPETFKSLYTVIHIPT